MNDSSAQTRSTAVPSRGVTLARFYRVSLVLIVWFGMLASSGCVSLNPWSQRRWPGWGRREQPLSKMDPPLTMNATSEQILARVNQNAYSEYAPDGLRSYRSDDVRVRMQGVPATMHASIVVEAPRNLRLRVANPLSGGEAVDIGSNEQQFWFWAKDSKPANVLVCAHDQIAIATQVTSLPLPFRPDWLMEVLGVAPISGTDYEVRRQKRNSPIVELVSEQSTPDQQPVRRIVKVHMTYGVVLEHRVESTRGELIAKATLSRHFRDPSTRLILPRQISIDWPAAGQQLALSLEFISVDFNSIPESDVMWQVPEMPGYEVFDLGEYALRQLGREADDLASEEPRSPKHHADSGRANQDDLEVIEVPDDEELVEHDSWSDDESLESIERPIRTASRRDQVPGFDESESELPEDSSYEEVPAESDSSEARPFPGD